MGTAAWLLTHLQRWCVPARLACALQEIKAAAKQGNNAGTRILAQQLVRLRAQITKMHIAQAQLQGVSASVTVSWRARGVSWRAAAALAAAAVGAASC
jgi:charged multivesicular body protein 2A/charged multivesicular body protein 2B